MAHVIAMLSSKGGVGKTTLTLTLAGELAEQGFKVGLVDADPNTPLDIWHKEGHAPDSITVYVDPDDQGLTIRDTIRQATEENDWVIVDTEGTVNVRVMQTIPATHLALIPITASIVDIREAAKAVKLCQDMSEGRKVPIHYALVRTRIEPVINSREDTAIAAMVRDSGLPVLDTALINRAAFRSMLRLGDTLHGLKTSETPGLDKARSNARDLANSMARFYAEAQKGEAADAA